MDSVTERFFDKVALPKHLHDCWEWTASKNRVDGYGNFTMPGSASAHRASWKLHKGPIPDGMWVCHKCDNPGCVNPNHLFLAPPRENTRDCRVKGRRNPPKRASHHWAKLAEEDIREIRRLRSEEGMSQTAIGNCHGVSQQQVSRIIRQINWKEVCK